MSQIQTLVEQKAGWMSRLFEIEVGTLVACDAEHDGETWVRREPFRFLYRSRGGHFFLLTDDHSWSVLDAGTAERLFEELSVKLAPTLQEPAPRLNAVDAGEDRDVPCRVVRNETWYFSILPQHLELPPGWFEVGFEGTKQECLEQIEAHYVFGAPQ
jgi:uncharacterized protein YbdZ (MbtH family)